MSRRNGTTKTSRAAEAAAAEAASTEETTSEEAQEEPTLGGNFLGINDLIVSERRRTRLSETTLAKTLELTMNFHVWTTQRAEQAAARNPLADYMSSGEISGDARDESLVGPEVVQEVITGEPDETEPTDTPPVGAQAVGEVILRDDPRHPLYGQPIVPKESN